MLFYQVGEWFQSYGRGQNRRSISDLMTYSHYANVSWTQAGAGGSRRGRNPRVIVVQPGRSAH